MSGRVDVVLIQGLAGAGKDTCAQILQRAIYEHYLQLHPAHGWGSQLGPEWSESSVHSHRLSDGSGDLALRWKTLPFSRALKFAAHHMLGIPIDLMFGEAAPDREEKRRDWQRYGKNARQWLQWLGTECGRDQIHQNLWLDRFFDQAELEVGFNAQHTVICAPDARFGNELTTVRDRCEQHYQWGCYAIRVLRPGTDGLAGTHKSETETAAAPVSLFDLVIQNDGTKEQLAEKLRPALE